MKTNPQQTATGQSAVEKVSWYQQLLSGAPGLIRMFWVYGILGSLVWLIVGASLGWGVVFDKEVNVGMYGGRALGSANPFVYLTDFGTFFMAGLCWYFVVVYRGIWRSANNYAGQSIWKILAKFWIIATAIPFVVTWAKAFSYGL